MFGGLTTPGARSSEFLVAILNAVAQVILAWNGTVSDGSATRYGVAGAIAYVISRGLAKYESRPGPAAGGTGAGAG